MWPRLDELELNISRDRVEQKASRIDNLQSFLACFKGELGGDLLSASIFFSSCLLSKIVGNQPTPYRGLSGPPGPEGPAIENIQSRLENFNPGLKISVSIKNFNLDRKVFLFTGPSWCYREGLDRTFQSTIARNVQSRRPRSNFFSIPEPSVGKV